MTVYFLTETNNANIHPIIDQPNNHDPTRARMLLYFELSFAAAKYAGANSKHTKMPTTATYLITNKNSPKCIIYIPYFALSPSSSSIRIS